MKVQQVINCMFTNWYPRFKKLTIKSVAVELPESVCDYLLSDGVVLPIEKDHDDDAAATTGTDNEVDWENADEQRSVTAPSFPEFEKQVSHCIQTLGGSVFPKLDWSCPKDAAWISADRTLCCHHIRDVFLLLKSSDFVTHDMTDPFEHCSDRRDSADQPAVRQLILREWQDISAEGEFRCFVKNSNLIAISQRHVGIHFPHLTLCKEDICHDILQFYHACIERKFADTDFTFDIWRKSGENIVLLDFNPFGPVTDSLLFSWNELTQKNPSDPYEYRCVLEKDIQPEPYRCYAVPQDFVHLSTGEDPMKFIDLLNIKIQDANDEESDSS